MRTAAVAAMRMMDAMGKVLELRNLERIFLSTYERVSQTS